MKFFFCIFLSNCRDVFGALTLDCNLVLEFGHINIMCYFLLSSIKFVPAGLKDLERLYLTLMCDTPSHYDLLFCEVTMNLLQYYISYW